MNVNSFLLERALRQLNLSEESLQHFRLVSESGNVNGSGFPKELFELSAPVVLRGLLNFSILQMNTDWIYPFWVHKQMDPHSSSFVPRSQNPLLINITHRDWTAIGSPTGRHEAIVDPRGLVTPLPREWSVDVWLVEDGEILLPGKQKKVEQRFEAHAPCVRTSIAWREMQLHTEAFTALVRGGKDVVFCRATVSNQSSKMRVVRVAVALRPFGVEGVAPIRNIEFRSRRLAFVDGVVGVVFAREPDEIAWGSGLLGDALHRLRERPGKANEIKVVCDKGLANAAALFDLSVPAGREESICYSIALGTNAELRKATVKLTWRVSFQRRKELHGLAWSKELEDSSKFEFGNDSIQPLFDASRSALLQLQDREFLSPGPYLYHHFWFRDAAPMLKAIDVLGFPHRVREVLDEFPARMTPDGFFRAPGGEWDSNGMVLWTVHQHYMFTRSLLWLKRLYPVLAKAGRWIGRMRRSTLATSSTHRGLMPRSLSAEHLGTVDQYYWDTFWSLAGLRALAFMAGEVKQLSDAREFEKDAKAFERDILQSLRTVSERLGEPLIPAAPYRPFDESSIGSISCLYPLDLFDRSVPQAQETLNAIVRQFVDDRGFYHPIIHSGYNAYLTLQIAHALLNLGRYDEAWPIAESMFRQATSTFTFPEAIHPTTGGGAMGDGHHGWAAAEVVLFLRDCMIRERGNVLDLFAGLSQHAMTRGRHIRISDGRTSFGKVSAALEFVSDRQLSLTFRARFVPRSSLESIEVYLPWQPRKISPSAPNHYRGWELCAHGVKLKLAPTVTSLLVQLED